MREHFGEQLRQAHPEAWREGHRRLYEHLKQKAKPLPETIEEMAPLYAAVVHGCLAGKNQEALDEVYFKRIQHSGEHYSWHKLGAYGSEAAMFSAFFDPPWERLAPGLRESWQAWVLNEAGFALWALGRLPEATDMLRLALQKGVAQENWKSAAARASNLSELLQTRGELREAEAAARESVAHADRSGDAFQRMGKRTTLAAALHALGRRKEAAALFEEAEQMQREWQPAYPLLYSLPGFRYCDLLLARVDRREAEVLARAAQTLEIAERNHWLLDIALDHLSLGRAHHLAAQKSALPEAQRHAKQAAEHLQQAVEGLRRAGQQDDLPLGLLARAAFHLDGMAGETPALHDPALPAARHDLEEALALATRCGFRLHEADARLGLARLALAGETPALHARAHLDAARALIEATGYHRRDGELAELEVRLAEKGYASDLPMHLSEEALDLERRLPQVASDLPRHYPEVASYLERHLSQVASHLERHPPAAMSTPPGTSGRWPPAPPGTSWRWPSTSRGTSRRWPPTSRTTPGGDPDPNLPHPAATSTSRGTSRGWPATSRGTPGGGLRPRWAPPGGGFRPREAPPGGGFDPPRTPPAAVSTSRGTSRGWPATSRGTSAR